MKHDEFSIGIEFTTRDSQRRWRCTDVGTRIITAIRIDNVDITTHVGGKYKSEVLTQKQADDRGWFNGPPYAIAEVVFDEDGLEGCSLA